MSKIIQILIRRKSAVIPEPITSTDQDHNIILERHLNIPALVFLNISNSVGSGIIL